MGAPIPTHNPLYIIHNFQAQVLILHDWGAKLKSQVRTHLLLSLSPNLPCVVYTVPISPNPRHYIFAKKWQSTPYHVTVL
jgi:hypothetical protein